MTLAFEIESGKTAHAYLFSGPPGIGKTTAARILAKAVKCLDLKGGEPCGKCANCSGIAEGGVLDIIEIDAASNRGIDEARELIERAAYKPSVGRFKVFMIDEAHQLTKDAFGALLKTLEEPPDYLKFVLPTTDPEKMLRTVLSRSQSDRATVEPRQTIAQYPFAERAQVHQYAGDYTELRGDRVLTIDFAGSTKALMIDAQPHSGQYFMWSNLRRRGQSALAARV